MYTAVLGSARGSERDWLQRWGTGNHTKHEWEKKKGQSSEQARVGTEVGGRVPRGENGVALVIVGLCGGA